MLELTGPLLLLLLVESARKKVSEMTEILVQPDCQLNLACEHLDHCCLDGLEEPPGEKRPPNTGARLWGRVRSKLLRQKVPKPPSLHPSVYGGR